MVGQSSGLERAGSSVQSNGYMTDHACRLSIRAFSPRKPRAGGDHSDRRAKTGLEIHCRPREFGRSTTRRGQRRRFGQQSKGSGGVHLRPLGAKFKFEALQFLNFGIRFYWVVVISGLSGQTSLENSRSKLEQLSNLVVHYTAVPQGCVHPPG